MQTFREAAGNGAGRRADDGQGKLTLVPDRFANSGVQGTTQLVHPGLIEHLVSTVQSQQPFFPRSLILGYGAALAASPLVLLSGIDSRAAAALARCFAQALVGPHSPQLLVVSCAEWHYATGENQHYHAVQQRFSGLRCQEFAQRAAEPENDGKAYFVCFESLPMRELVAHAEAMGSGLPQIALSAVVAPGELAAALARFPQATLLDVRAPLSALEQCRIPPPVGLQRLWMQARVQAQATGRRSAGDDVAARMTRNHWLARTNGQEALRARGLPLEQDAENRDAENSENEPARRAA